MVKDNRVSVSPRMLERLNTYAAAKGISRRTLIEMALTKYMDARNG